MSACTSTQEDAAVSQLLLDTLKPLATHCAQHCHHRQYHTWISSLDTRLVPQGPSFMSFKQNQTWWLGDFHGALNQFLQDLPEQDH
jgi:hypothetical protein